MRQLRGRFVDGVFEPNEPIDLGGGEPERRSYVAHVQSLLAAGTHDGADAQARGRAVSAPDFACPPVADLTGPRGTPHPQTRPARAAWLELPPTTLRPRT